MSADFVWQLELERERTHSSYVLLFSFFPVFSENIPPFFLRYDNQKSWGPDVILLQLYIRANFIFSGVHWIFEWFTYTQHISGDFNGLVWLYFWCVNPAQKSYLTRARSKLFLGITFIRRGVPSGVRPVVWYPSRVYLVLHNSFKLSVEICSASRYFARSAKDNSLPSPNY